jgi:hypothetical protein
MYNYIRLLIISIFIVISQTAISQNIAVKSYRPLQKDMEARVNPIIDNNGDKCAIIKIVTSGDGFEFEAGMMGIIKTVKKTGEYWLYIPYGSQKLTIKHDRLGVLRNYIYPEFVEKANVYEMVLVCGKVITVVEDLKVPVQWLVIESEPLGANVFINDKDVGQTPLNRKFKEGEYTYRIEYPRYHTYIGDFILISEKKKLNVKLKPQFGNILVSSIPEDGISIYLDSRNTGKKTPYLLKDVDTGKHIVQLQSKWYKNDKQHISVNDDDTTKAQFNMNPSFSEVSIKVDEGADVLIDGVKKAKGSFVGRLLEGYYEVTVQKAQHYSLVKQVQSKAGIPIDLEFSLKKKVGSVDVMCQPGDAKILLDGKDCGTTPNTIHDVLIGEHVIVLSKDGYGTLSKQILVKENENIVLNETLSNGESIHFSSNPGESSLWIDGEFIGSTPNDISLSYGKHSVKLSNLSSNKEEVIEVSQEGQKEFIYDLRNEYEINEDLNWNHAVEINSKNVYDKYIADYPTGRYVNQAKEKNLRKKNEEETILYNNAVASNFLTDYEKYIEKYPNGRYAHKVNKVLKESYLTLGDKEYNEKEYGKARTYYTEFINRFSDDKLAEEIESKLLKINRKMLRKDAGYFLYAFDMESEFGLNAGGVMIDGFGYYFNCKLDVDYLLISSESIYSLSELDNMYSDPISLNEKRDANVSVSVGVTYKILYPLWVYGGTGVGYYHEYEKYTIYNSEEWVLDDSQKDVKMYTEFGLLCRINKTWMAKFGVLYNDGLKYQFGIGLTF